MANEFSKIDIFSRNFQLFVALLLTDTSLPQNASLITRIKSEALESGIYEGFLESAPQLIFQGSIILRTGNTSNFITLFFCK